MYNCNTIKNYNRCLKNIEKISQILDFDKKIILNCDLVCFVCDGRLSNSKFSLLTNTNFTEHRNLDFDFYNTGVINLVALNLYFLCNIYLDFFELEIYKNKDGNIFLFKKSVFTPFFGIFI